MPVLESRVHSSDW